MKKQYKTYKHFMAYLSGMDVHVKRFKLAALFLSPFRKSILLEPDILFLKYPKEIAEFSNSEKNFFQIFSVDAYNWLAKKNYHWDFSMRKFYYSKLKLNVDLLFNGGLMLVNRKTINDKLAKRIDEFLKLCEVTEYEKSVFAEETLLSSVFTKDASVLLPPRQYVTLLQYFEYHDMKKNGGESNLISLHISSNVRPLFIYQAVKLSIQSGLFRLKRQASTN